MVDRRAYPGAAVPTTLAAGITNIDTALVVTALTGYPAGAVKWWAVLDKGTVNEEKILVTNVSGFNLTAVRGQDGTTARTHSIGATLQACISATDMDEANFHTSSSSQVHGLPVGSAVVGTDATQTLKNKTLDFGGTGGNTATNIPTTASPALKALIDANTAAIATEVADRTTGDNNRYTKAEANAQFVDTNGDTMTGFLTLANLAPTNAKHAAPKDYVDQQVPIGSITMFGGPDAPTGWLECDGSAVSRTTYATLFALVGTTYGVGDGSTTFNVPNFGGRNPRGASGGTTIGQSGGATTHVIPEAALPSHTHAIDHDHASFSTASGGTHNHSIPAQNDIGSDPTGGARAGAQDAGTPYNSLDTATDGAHTHTIDVPAFTGTSGTGSGSGAALDTMDPWLAVTFIIRAL
jgi:microcystin-dependent protein